MILLDTCTLLWLALDQSRLSDRARDCLRANAGALRVSAVTAFEIGHQAAAGKLQLKLPPARWFPRACELHGMLVVPLDAAQALAAAALPKLHKDPFDRLLVGTARQLGLTILTPDPLIRQYPKLKTIW